MPAYAISNSEDFTQLSNTPQEITISRFEPHYFLLHGKPHMHTLNINEMNDAFVIFSIKNEPIMFALKDGEHAEIDITGDGTPDFVLILDSHTITNATARVMQYFMDSPAEPDAVIDEPSRESIEDVSTNEELAAQETLEETKTSLPLIQAAATSAPSKPPLENNEENKSRGLFIWIMTVLLMVAGVGIYTRPRPEYHENLHQYISIALHKHAKSEEEIYELVTKAGWDKKTVKHHIKLARKK